MGPVGTVARFKNDLNGDIYTLRRIVPKDRGKTWGRQMNYAIIGCGLIGRKRLAGLPAGSELTVACDTNLARAEELVKLAKTGRAVADYKQAVTDPRVDAVIVATINSALAEVSAAAIRAGKPVLVEKPAGISSAG
jgi:predicted dehydrogenase